MSEDPSPRAVEWAQTIPAFDAGATALWRRVRPWLIWALGAVVLAYTLLHQLLFWAAVVAALFVAGWLQGTPAVRLWMRHQVVRLRLRLLPPTGVYIDWTTPAQDHDHEIARAEFARVMTVLHTLPRDVEGDGRTERRKWLYAATEQADGLMIRGDNPFLSIGTRSPRAASAPAPLGFVGVAAAVGGLAKWRVFALAALGAVAALLYARGEVLETQRDAAQASLAATETALSAERSARMAAESNARDWQDRLSTDIRLALEQGRISREYYEQQQARAARLQQRRAARNETTTVTDGGGVVDLGDSLRELAAPAAATLPDLPATTPGSDSPGRVHGGPARGAGFPTARAAASE